MSSGGSGRSLPRASSSKRLGTKLPPSMVDLLHRRGHRRGGLYTGVGGSMLSRDQRGFTLIELMVVVVILGILAGLIIPKIMGRPEEAKRLKARMQIEQLEQSLKLY